jgi:hypothetical protein
VIKADYFDARVASATPTQLIPLLLNPQALGAGAHDSG